MFSSVKRTFFFSGVLQDSLSCCLLSSADHSDHGRNSVYTTFSLSLKHYVLRVSSQEVQTEITFIDELTVRDGLQLHSLRMLPPQRPSTGFQTPHLALSAVQAESPTQAKSIKTSVQIKHKYFTPSSHLWELNKWILQ